MIIVPEMLESLKSKLLEVMLSGFVKQRSDLTYDVVVLAFKPEPDMTEALGERVYEVKALLVGSEEGGLVDYDSLAYLRKVRVDFALPFRALLNDNLDVIGVEILEGQR